MNEWMMDSRCTTAEELVSRAEHLTRLGGPAEITHARSLYAEAANLYAAVALTVPTDHPNTRVDLANAAIACFSKSNDADAAILRFLRNLLTPNRGAAIREEVRAAARRPTLPGSSPSASEEITDEDLVAIEARYEAAQWPEAMETTLSTCVWVTTSVDGHAGDVVQMWYAPSRSANVARAQCIVANDAPRLVRALRAERARVAAQDDPALDGTDAAHPAWWRGHDQAVVQLKAQRDAAFADRDRAEAARDAALKTVEAVRTALATEGREAR